LSSHAGSGDQTPITSVDQLAAWHAQGEKPRDRWRVGTEYEKFGFDPALAPIVYAGRPGVRDVLEALATRFGWEPGRDAGQLIALSPPSGGALSGVISLEPGGQLELSGAPQATIHETRAELDQHLGHLDALTGLLGVRWLWLGHQPVHSLDRLDWMPKRRYAIMRDYLPRRGALARNMMQATSTVQANLDFGDARDMGRKLRIAMGISSIVTAMFANSPFLDGRPAGYRSVRATVWSATDPDRQGLLPFVFDGDAPSYERWVRWALDVPMFFIARAGALIPANGLPFRTFMRDGLAGHRATMEDWETHVSTLFPDVRIKRYLEVRTADCVPPRYICALPALWKGILYSTDALEAAWDLVKRWTFDERLAHREAVPRDGLAAPVPRSRATTAELAIELVNIAEAGLEAAPRPEGTPSEVMHLAPLAALIRDGRCPADEALARYRPGRPPEELLASLLDLHASQQR
jgi:glutamate--cysteine ligase